MSHKETYIGEFKTKKEVGKNLFKTYEVNGKQYIDNIPKNISICISKEQYIEYEQQKEENKRLNNIIKEQGLQDKPNYYVKGLEGSLKEYQEEIERLNNIINKGIEAINVYQNEKTLSVGYQDLKRIRGILQGNQFDLERFEEYLQELKGSNDNEENNQ